MIKRLIKTCVNLLMAAGRLLTSVPLQVVLACKPDNLFADTQPHKSMKTQVLSLAHILTDRITYSVLLNISLRFSVEIYQIWLFLV